MNQITESNLLKFSFCYSVFCVAFGFALLLLFYLLPTDANFFVGIIGAVLLLLASSGALFLFVLSLIHVIRQKIQIIDFLKIASVLAGAAIIGMLALELGFKLASTIRLTLTNATGTTISNVMVDAADKIQYNNLEPNQSKTIWIDDCGDCDIKVSYTMAGIQHKEIVYGYRGGLSGENCKYLIGIDSLPIDQQRYRNSIQK